MATESAVARCFQRVLLKPGLPLGRSQKDNYTAVVAVERPAVMSHTAAQATGQFEWVGASPCARAVKCPHPATD